MAELRDVERNAQELTDEPQELDSDRFDLPKHAEWDGEDILYTLQYPLSAEGNPAPDFRKVRIPPKIYARDMRNMSRGTTAGEEMFYLMASMCRVPTHLLDRVDARDYVVLSQLVELTTAKNSEAVRSEWQADGGR
jgi:hypothetical protein